MPTASTRPDVIRAAFTGTGVALQDQHFAAQPGDADCLKFAACEAVIRGNCSASGGDENACDINHESSVTVEDGAVLAIAGGDQAGLVLKGASSLRTLGTGCVVFEPSPKSKADILQDDWSDQSQKASTGALTARRTDGAPVRVVFGRWRRPKINGPSRVVWGWTIGLHFYNPAKAVIRAALGIKRSEKGPAWF